MTVFSQSLDHLTLLAHYPLKSTPNDTTGRYGPMDLRNTPYQDGGIYCNGIYPNGVQQDACDAKTPYIAELDFREVAVSADFKIFEYPVVRNPVLVCEPYGWRWLYVFVDPDSTIGYGSGNDFPSLASSSVKCSLNQWHNATVTWDSLSSKMTLFLDGVAIDSSVVTLIQSDSRFAGITHGGVGRTFKGIFRNLKIYSRHSSTDVNQSVPVQPDIFSLDQNYPNPFNSETQFQYQLPVQSTVRITVFSALGQEITTLLTATQLPGLHQVIWSGRDRFGNPAVSGVYFCQFQFTANGEMNRSYQKTIKVSLLKS